MPEQELSIAPAAQSPCYIPPSTAVGLDYFSIGTLLQAGHAPNKKDTSVFVHCSAFVCVQFSNALVALNSCMLFASGLTFRVAHLNGFSIALRFCGGTSWFCQTVLRSSLVQLCCHGFATFSLLCLVQSSVFNRCVFFHAFMTARYCTLYAGVPLLLETQLLWTTV